MIDLGDPVPLSVSIYDATGVLANATLVVCTITLPDASTATPAVSNPSAGIYTATYTPTLSGRHGVRWVATGTNASAYTDAFDVDDLAPTGIVSLADVREQLDFLSTANDEKIRLFIDAATDFIESRVGPVVRRTITQTVVPSSGMLLLDGPVISLTSIAAARGYSGTYNVASLFLDKDIVYPPAYASSFYYPVTVTYVAGRTVIPPLLREATLDYITWMWRRQRGGTPESLLTGQVSDYEIVTPATVPYSILQALEPFIYRTVA